MKFDHVVVDCRHARGFNTTPMRERQDREQCLQGNVLQYQKLADLTQPVGHRKSHNFAVFVSILTTLCARFKDFRLLYVLSASF